MNTITLPTHTAALFNAAVARAAELLRAGQLVALPTETVYGLAANALNADAVAKIYAAKGRPGHNPIIVHVAGFEMAQHCAAHWPPLAEKLAQAFWPGPLTMVLPRAKIIPNIVTADGDTVGIRWPSHPFIQAVIRACDFPIAAPSANLSNQVSPTNADHVRKGLNGKIPLIIDGGQSQVGIESTVIDLTTTPPRLLRPGMIHAESLLAVMPVAGLQTGNHGEESVLRSPGLLKKHYSPKAKVLIWQWHDEKDLADQLSKLSCAEEKIHLVAHTHIPLGQKIARVSVIPHDAEAFARALYAELHQCDEAGAEYIIIEALPIGESWRAIADRLARAAA